MTMNSTGRKNRIIGTVSLGGSLLLGFGHAHVAIFLCHDPHRLRHRRAVALGLLQRHADRLHALDVGALGKVFVSLAAVLQIGQFGVGLVSSSASGIDCEPISCATFLKAASIDMPDSTQIRSRSSASGNARLIDSWRFWILFLMKRRGRYTPR